MAKELPDKNFFDTEYPKANLKGQVVRGGMWVFTLRITDQLFRLARTVVLARVLAPSDFGLFGIALLAMSALETFSQTGFNTALIQKKGDTKPYLDTAWTVQVIRGILLALLAFVIAPYVAVFFDAPAAKPILQVIAFSMLLQGFTNVGVLYFQKELEFHKQFVYMFSGTLADIGVAIPAAFLLRSVWALVFGLLAGNLVRMVVSYFVHAYRPRMGFSLQQFRELSNFGKYIFLQTIVIFFLTHGDDAFVGKVLGTTALGFYQLAYRLSNLPATEITHIISQVTFPAYSKLQDQKDRLKRALIKTFKFTTLVSIPIAGGIFVLAPEFTRAFLGERWMPMVPAIQVMCLFGAIRSVGATFGPIYQAIARVDIPLKINVTQLVLLVAIIYPLSLYWGILGTAVAITLCAIIALYLISKRIMGLLEIDFVSLFKPLFLSVLASVGMIATMLILKTFVLNTVNCFSVLYLIVIGGICYLGLGFIIYTAFGLDLRN